MALSNGLVSQNLGVSSRFNWPWFIELFVCGILVLFFLFYFNRLFATIVSYLVRLYTWRTFRVWIDIQAIQISLLGGRIFFKGVRYHGENETILIQSGYITWRYWLRDVKQVDLTRFDEQSSDAKDDSHLESNSSADSKAQEKDEELGAVHNADNAQARVAVFVSGVEWFIYNRTPMYDAILRESSKNAHQPEDDSKSSMKEPIKPTDKVKIPTILRRRPVTSASSSTGSQTMPSVAERNVRNSNSEGSPTRHEKEPTSSDNDVPLAQSLLVQMLPIYVECNRAAVAMGNDNTKALLVTTISKARGHIDASGCSHHDMFRQLFDFEIEHPIVQMRPNPDSKTSQMDTAESVVSEGLSVPKKQRWWIPHFSLRDRKEKVLASIYGRLPWLQSSTQSLHDGHRARFSSHANATTRFVVENAREWHGLGRYLDESESDDHQAWADIEYGRYSTVLDCPAVHLNFYWDVPGRVTVGHIAEASSWPLRDINGIAPPAYGLDLTVKGGSIDYGPWTDRLRAELQAMFLPASYRSAAPASLLSVGDWRQSTRMVIRVDVEDEITLRVPTRERSKDWQWRGRATAVRDAAALRQQREKRHFRFRKGQKSVAGPDIRPFGWLSFSVAADSTVRYEMDMVAGVSGYSNRLQLDLKETKASSSVNHALLWRCNAQRLDCDLSNPLRWNGPHEWAFNVESDSMRFFLLRDHMFLLTDLISDFTAGQKSDYMTFVPFTYKLHLKFTDLQLLLNANDFNIIDNPCDTDSNAFLILGMRSLLGEVQIPMQNFAPPQNSVLFEAHGERLYLDLSTPLWNTLRNFAQNNRMATLEDLKLDGSYNYCTATSPLLTDALLMNITGTRPEFNLQGFLIRYFINVKENYFGDFLHYKTLEEHQANLMAGQPLVEVKKTQSKKDNDLDVILSIRAVESAIMMPAFVYDRSENLRVDVMNLDMDMRFTNYYMDLQISSSPIEAAIEKLSGPEKTSSGPEIGSTQLYIDHLTVFGHRLFGAPPSEPAYVCHWDVDAGSILGECSADFLRVTTSAIESLIYTMDDDQNALKTTEVSIVHDATFLRVQSAGLRVWIREQNIAFLVEVDPFDVAFNDWAEKLFSKQLKLFLPKILLAAVDTKNPHRYNESQVEQVSTLAYVETSVSIATLDKTANFGQNKSLQQGHLHFHDLKTHRALVLLNSSQASSSTEEDVSWAEGPANIPVPAMLDPLVSSHSDLKRRSPHTSNTSAEHQGILLGSANQHSQVTLNTDMDSLMAKSPSLVAAGNLESSRMHNPGSYPKSKMSQKSGFSSAWLPPNFSLRNLKPATNELPSLTVPGNHIDATNDPYQSTQDIPEQHPSMAHGSSMIRFPCGLRAFFDSELSIHVIQMIASMQDRGPVAAFDSVERKTIDAILQLNSRRLRQVSDIAVYIPGVALRLLDRASSRKIDYLNCDQYDIQLSKAQVVLRTAPTVARYSNGQNRADVLSAQVSFQDIEFDIAERSTSHTTTIASLSGSLSNMTMWLSLQDKIQTDIQLGKLEAVTSGASVDKLALLFQRSFDMIERISDEARDIQGNAYERNLVYQLTVLETKIQDPSFVSRPSYVLRSAEDHVRQNNSWRALMILRHRLQSLSEVQLGQISKLDSREQTEQGSDPRRAIIKALGNHLVGNTNNEKYQPLLKSIFGRAGDGSTQVNKVSDIHATSFVGQILIVLDPGSNQSEVSLESCDFSFSQSPMLEKEQGHVLGDTSQRAKIVVKSWMSGFRVDLNWELVALAKSMISHLQREGPSTSKVTETTETGQSQTTSPVTDLTVVSGTDNVLIRLTTLNFVVAMGAENFKSSAILLQSANHSFSTIMLASKSAFTTLTSHATRLLQVTIETPNVYNAHQRHFGDDPNPDTIQAAAACSKLRFDITEAPVGLLQAANLIIAHEVAAIQEIVGLVQARPSEENPAKPISPNKLPRLRVGLFLGDYKIQIALLPTVQYLISGKVARTSITPLGDSKFVAHIDLKRNKHALMPVGASIDDAISILEIPPIGARVSLALTTSTIKIDARSVIEKVNMEASALQACLEAIYNPRNAEYFKTVTDAVQDCQETLTHSTTFNKVRKGTKEIRAGTRRYQYSIHLVSAGLAVMCTSPVRQGQNSNAELTFDIRYVSANLRKAEHLSTLKFSLRAPAIGLRLHRNTPWGRSNAGSFTTGLKIDGTQEPDDTGAYMQTYRAHVSGISLDLFTETPAVAVDIAAYVQEQLISLSTTSTTSKVPPLKRLTLAHNEFKLLRRNNAAKNTSADPTIESSTLLQNSVLMLGVNAIKIRWILDDATPVSPNRRVEDLVLSIRKIDLTTQREDSARLSILDLQIQLAPKDQPNPTERTHTSALLPEVVFKAAHVSTTKDRRFAFQAAGKALDLKIAADSILPLSAIQKSLTKASIELQSLQQENKDDSTEVTAASISSVLGNKRLASLLVDADFAGAIFSITPRVEPAQNSAFGLLKGSTRSRAGRYGQAVQSSNADDAVLRAPGIAMKVEYQDAGRNDPHFNMEVKVAASNNVLAPTVVPLVLEIYSSVKEIIGEGDPNVSRSDIKAPAQKYLSEAANQESDPTAVLGRVRLNASLWVQRQEFSLTCQPIARVQTTASFDDIFVTINTVQNEDQDRIVSILTKFNNLHASVQHVYSRESTASFEVNSIVMSLMNSKHVSNKNGISAILNISPMSTNVNARQLQDFLLFREIWYPKEIRRTSKPATPAASMSESQTYAMQKYQELTATAALPWHAVVSVQELKLQVDFGQALGTSSFTIADLWASSKKSSDWEQNLCVGFNNVGIESTGRMSGFVELDNFRGRTAIRWPIADSSGARAPLVQASLGFDYLRLKAAFDYQPFAVADVSSFEFLMYNVRPQQQQENDRLVGILDGGKVQAFCISAAGGQILAIIQAFERLFQEKRDAYQASLHEVERLLRRKSVFPTDFQLGASTELEEKAQTTPKSSHFLHTDVVVTVKAIDIGAFPNTFFDNQILKIQAVDAQARFAVATIDSKIRSGLGLSLGQVRLALSSVSRPNTKALGEVEISDVIERATGSRGGTIMKVPRVVASMQTWQQEQSNLIEYVFRSTFHGKVDVGWNYSRISFIRGMWETHSAAMAQRLGKPLAPSAVTIRAEDAEGGSGQEKITAVVNMPQTSKYEYVALEPPIIDTPQLRDMGEATPPLEWIGLHRDKLPNVTHSIIIVTLLEVAREVEDAYTRILGTG